jgi:phage FluMu protein Com
MSLDVTPGSSRRIRCPQCAELLFFRMEGGPLQLKCGSCSSMVDLDVVHDGKRWTVRRVRGAGTSS